MTSTQKPSASPAPETHTAAILSIEPAPNGRNLVTFRTVMTTANPSGRGSVYTPLLSTTEGRDISSTLHARVNQGPVRRRTTVLEVATEACGGGEQLKVIQAVR